VPPIYLAYLLASPYLALQNTIERVIPQFLWRSAGKVWEVQEWTTDEVRGDL
jgi:hypothetical protein